MHYAGLLLRAVIQKLERRPDLRPQAEEIDAQFYGQGVIGRGGEGGGRGQGDHLASGHGNIICLAAGDVLGKLSEQRSAISYQRSAPQGDARGEILKELCAWRK